MTAPVTVADLRVRARRLYERDSRQWAAAGGAGPVLEVPLHPPTERAALADLEATRAWVATWRRADGDPDVELVWGRRSWSRVGSQEVPERAIVRGAEAIARVAGEAPAWVLISERQSVLRAVAGTSEEAVGALCSQSRTIEGLDPADFNRLIDVLGWLRDNPASGRRIRELPIRGIHSKWIEARRGLVEALHRVGTGATGLGFLEPSPLVRMRILDPALALGGLTDVSAPVDDLVRLSVRPQRVYVFENLATVLAMPEEPDAIVIHGGGHRVDLVAGLPWAQRVIYWGDLDSHGFAILHQLRASGVEASSVLMDTETLIAHRDLWVDDPEPNTGVFRLLTVDEKATLQLLSAQGNVRLEQERIPWEYALARLPQG
ncbi:Wadjet anti-phage system protein JetD domain-containing protein [Microbacterium ureisolvens]|uniref:Wadjet anti-phage system protein JetD domain-containing protein n=1 Tax=Microbacterium ureisolvens TaxID=2781186 RepID=UPI00363182B4